MFQQYHVKQLAYIIHYNNFNIMAHIKQKQESQGALDKQIEKEVKQSYGQFGPSIFEQQSSLLTSQKSITNNNEQLPLNITKTLQNLQQKMSTLQQRLTDVQAQNKQLKQAFHRLQQQHESTRQKQQQKYIKDIKRLKDQLELYQQYNDQIIQKIGNKCQVQESKIMGFGDYIEKMQYKQGMRRIKSQSQSQGSFNNSNKRYIGEISRLSIQSKGFKDVQHSRSFLNCSKIQDLNLPPVTLRSVHISPNCLNSKFFNIEVGQSLVSLTYCGDSGTWTHILSSDPIPVSKILQFVYKISKSTLNSISVGIIDKKYQRLRFCGKNEVNCIFYYGGSGRLWEAGRKLEKEGKGFKQGDTLIMLVYLQQGFIRWYVNGRLEAQYDNRQLFTQGKGKDIDWVAFINMSTNKDKILWQVGQLN